jgi:hypothetical protein
MTDSGQTPRSRNSPSDLRRCSSRISSAISSADGGKTFVACLFALQRATHIKWRKVGVPLHHSDAQLRDICLTVKLMHPFMTIGAKRDGILNDVRPASRKPQNVVTVEKRLTIFFKGCLLLA